MTYLNLITEANNLFGFSSFRNYKSEACNVNLYTRYYFLLSKWSVSSLVENFQLCVYVRMFAARFVLPQQWRCRPAFGSYELPRLDVDISYNIVRWVF